MLFTEDGQELGHNYDLGDYDFANEDDADTIRGTWAFDGPPEQSGRVILRVLENNPDSWSIIDTPEEAEKPFVFAEFTIDWKNGTAQPSETYLKEGYQKADTEEYPNTIFHPDFTGGYLIRDIWYAHDVWHDSQRPMTSVQMFSDVEYQSVELRFYKQDQLVGTVAAHPESEYNDEEFQEGNWPAYRDETGFYTALPAEKATDGQARYELLFVYYYPEGAELDQYGHLAASEHVDRIDLVNRETGEVLLENLKIGDAYKP